RVPPRDGVPPAPSPPGPARLGPPPPTAPIFESAATRPSFLILARSFFFLSGSPGLEGAASFFFASRLPSLPSAAALFSPSLAPDSSFALGGSGGFSA